MNDFEKRLKDMVLAPYISKATALIGKKRKIGGNAFRHQINTMCVLIDYKYTNPILIKSSIIHDLIEDIPSTNISELLSIDSDANAVVDLVLQVTRQNGESKINYLKRIQNKGSKWAKILKCADRISNIIDLNSDTYDLASIRNYVIQTEEYILPFAKQVNQNMFIELTDLLNKKKSLFQ